MFTSCDACNRPNPTDLAQMQVERGELVATKLGLSLRARSRDLFVLCGDCGDLILGGIRGIIAEGGVLAARQRS